MEKGVEKSILWIYQVTTIIIALASLYFMLKTAPKETASQTLIIFGIIMLVFVVIIIYGYIYSRYKKMCDNIKSNYDDLKDMKKDLNFKDLFDKMDKRLSKIEGFFEKISFKINKKGQIGIDPRIILWFIMLILFYMFLRSLDIL